MAETIVQGRDLMLFDASGNSYSYASNHVLTVDASLTEVSSKDHGIWGAQEVVSYKWEISTENLYTEKDYNTLFDMMIAGQKIKVRFGLKSQTGDGTVVDGDYPNWTSKATGYYEGYAILSGITANAPNGDKATYSAKFTGVGKLARIDAVTPTE